MAAGDFSASNLRDALLKADKMWADDMVRPDYEADVEVVRAIRAEQNANVTILEDTRKDVDVEVAWINACGVTVEDCPDICVMVGDELETDKKAYSLDLCKSAGFKVSEQKFRSNLMDMEDAVAKGTLAASRVLDNYLAQQLVAEIDSFSGVNAVTNGRGTVDGTNTYVPEANWTPGLFAYFMRVATMNKFSNPYLLSGVNMWEQSLEVALDKLNGEGKGAAAKYKLMRQYYDLFNIDTVNDPDAVTYLINRGAIAMAFKNEYERTPKVYNGAGITKSLTASRNIPGIFYDTIYTTECSGDDILHSWKMKLKAGIFLNPTGCTDTRTGVLRFVNGDVPIP